MRKLMSVVLASLALALSTASARTVALAQDAPSTGGRLELMALNDLTDLDNVNALDLNYNLVAGALYEVCITSRRKASWKPASPMACPRYRTTDSCTPSA